ncbi:hypothetical protein GTY81_19970 [Streptomyces sp. SID8366]|uniref:hypothetical protein n=1 Tax=unclassified Streptomyces TaxID=2593676 RepID=UPI000DC42F11|nr:MULTISPECIES: hypothetical protein [unclassified Streptomyces]MYU06112.1 hypothetical protein [Streptomyces sp. SID8366]MYU61685.1 hypothetical protein [Streptomyces sp. SID69]RAJ64182.1 hypothetical protein K376_01279 [Streptomyces sp. PsTaAH-130]
MPDSSPRSDPHYDHDDPHPGPLPHQTYAALDGGPLDGLLLGHDTASGQLVTAVIEDVEYVRLLAQSPGATVPREKITKVPSDSPNMDPAAEGAWS